MKKVIVVFGNAGHGKDTLSDMMQGTIECSSVEGIARRMSFAWPVKEAARALVGMPERVAYGEQEERVAWRKFGKNAREWLQWIGTAVGRQQIDEDIWVKRIAQEILEDERNNIFIISDGRFENEFDLQTYLIDDEGSRLADVVNVVIRRDTPVDMSHPSESIVANMADGRFNFVVNNDGAISHLLQKAENILNSVLGGKVPRPKTSRIGKKLNC